ncbi:bifunctional YncE family protein/alkaline phosphatase family protein [Paenibacillus filicis]|uniref:Bifunctional YncE family protein/alkaline phosphatase family protein n=1 Tax=Paenibacillus gyeongsangnamensis TaxID=3388067 RepID=A0ABT4QH21_9BACL|nr:bifunctional YncE family protein/alkaline phosphatase family protein [Paenibacillus filicis]MCZ8516149.1 bifunctional YncE family protein/alkaline phosphatase family protein [Paenibacillus filicis]
MKIKSKKKLVTVVTLAALTFSSSVAFAKYEYPKVGRQPDGSVLTTTNQFVKPAGDTVEQTGRPMALKVRPDGKTAVNMTWDGKGQFTVTNLTTLKVIQQVSAPAGVGSGKISYGGLLYSPDGSTLWAAQTKNLLRWQVAADGTLSNPTSIPLPGVAGRAAIPSGLAFTPDGQQILVTLNGNNTLAVLDAVTGAVVRQIPVGNAPRDVVVIGNHAYVSNQGGRPATTSDSTNDSYGTAIVANNQDGSATTGTVSEVDFVGGKEVRTYDVGLQPSALLAHGTDLLVANSNDDSVSVIDTAKQQLSHTFDVNPIPGAPFGSSPNALAMLDDTHVAVSLGTDNAVAVYEYHDASQPAVFEGLIPTGWYPGSIEFVPALNKLVIASQKGVGSLGDLKMQTHGLGTMPGFGHSVYSSIGTVSVVAKPTSEQMQEYTKQVWKNNNWQGIQKRNQTGNGKAAPVAIPKRIGDPSTIKHVFLIIKENRTYDQVLGDDKRGNGDPLLTQFGQMVTPNFHALATQGPLIDNLYSSGTMSADGHQYLTQAFVNDYLNQSIGHYTRSYPYNGGDALAYAKSGFLWDNATKHGVSVRNWGEYTSRFQDASGNPDKSSWQQWYQDSKILEGKANGQLHTPVGSYQAWTDVPGLRKITQGDFPGFQMQIPDQYRADIFLRDLKQYENDGSLPQLNVVQMPTDHTSGTSANQPIPASMVADNDLAVGRIVDAISHSKFGKDSAVFMIEDDTQDGVDHTDGHRNPTLIFSPYAKRGEVVHNYYTQLNVTRTIEQILGLPPMNQMDMAAVPMYDAFTNKPDYTPYTALPNQFPLDVMNQPISQLTGVAKAWAEWSNGQNWTSEDMANMAQSNRAIWYASNNFTQPYPGDSKVLYPNEVPGADWHMPAPSGSKSNGNKDGDN